MCGIVGIWDFKNDVDKNVLKHMRDLLQHRGPDDKGIYIDGNIGLGHRRLSIIDLSKAGHQPMCNEDGTVWITYNGEIYNFKEIREELERKGHQFKSDTDTEVVIHAYEEYGPECLSLFNGMFAFAIWDGNKKQLFLARDRIGIKPLYYSQYKNSFVFASEMKAILAFPNFKNDINKKILGSFLRFSYYLDPGATIFQNIFCLEPGFYALYTKSGFKKYKFWDIKYGKYVKDKGLIINELLARLESSIKRRMLSDVPLGVFLSGGMDSSTIVALMSKYTQKVRTFSVGFDGYNDELPIARRVSDHYGTDHTELSLSADDYQKGLGKLVWHHDDPITHKAAIPLYFLSKKTKNKATTILTGEGSDELFAGYQRYRKLRVLNRLSKIASKMPWAIKKLVESDIIVNAKIKKYLDYVSRNNFNYIPGSEIFPRYMQRKIFEVATTDNTSEKIIGEYCSKSRDQLNNNLYIDWPIPPG